MLNLLFHHFLSPKKLNCLVLITKIRQQGESCRVVAADPDPQNPISVCQIRIRTSFLGSNPEGRNFVGW